MSESPVRVQSVKIAVVILLWSFLAIPAFAQTPVTLKPDDITDPFQLPFLHANPENRLDSLVLQLLEYPKVDSLEMTRLVTKVGALRTENAYCLLYLTCCPPVVVKDLNAFNRLSGILTYFGAYRVLNTYYLNGAVNPNQPDLEFANAVINQCLQNKPACVLPQDPIPEKQPAPAVKLRTRKYDKQIVRIIDKNSNLKKGNNGDSISSQVLRLPFVSDVMWDGCYDKIAIYPTFYTLAVKMTIDGQETERCYHIVGSKIRYIGLNLGKIASFKRMIYHNDKALDYKSSSFCPGFIKKAREYCDEIKNRQ